MSFPEQQCHASDLLDAEPLRLSSIGNADDINFILGDVADMDLDFGDLFLEQPVVGMDAPVKCDGMPPSSMPAEVQAQDGKRIEPQPTLSFGNSVHNVSCNSFQFHREEEVQARPKPVSPLKAHHAAPVDRNLISIPPLPILGRGVPPRRVLSAGSGVAPPLPRPRGPRPQRRVTTDSLRPSFDAPSFAVDDPDRALYREAILQLARSMKRTELSRRQLAMMGVPSLRPRPQPVAFGAQQRLRRRVAGGVAPCASRTVSPVPPPGPEAGSVMDDFFAGRRSTLTDGLEHSRRQLRMYVNRMGSC